MSRKKILLLSLICTIACTSFAQEHIVEGVSPRLSLPHVVAARETWYSVARSYNLSAKDIAAYNKLSAAKPLAIGEQIQIPLTPANFSQDDQKNSSETFVPVYHVVQPKEWMYRISVNYNKVPVESLQKWNGIGKDGAKPGTKLIIGYLKVKDANASIVGNTPDPAKDKSQPTKPGLIDKNAAKTTTNPTPQPAPVSGTQADGSTAVASGVEGSYFKNQFEDNGRNVSGIAGIFKSSSGWSDGKYYVLISNIPIGTIVKVILPATSKSVYAKVLGELPDMKESEGLGLRVSDAAAHELGSPESKFSVSVKY